GKAPDTSRTCTLRADRVRTLGGLDIALERQQEILSALGFEVTRKDGDLVCGVPSWRPDVNGEADLVEEVCRIAGLDNIPPVPLSRPDAVAKPVLTARQKRMVATRRRLADCGMHEAVTWAFLKKDFALLFGGGSREMELANPISTDLSDMRPSLIPNLISAAGRNVARGFANVALFEVGQTYAGLEPEDEELRAAGIRRGETGPRHWSEKPRPVNAFDAKAGALAALEAAGAPVQSLQVGKGAPDWFHPGRSGTFQLGPKNQLGWFGEVHPLVLEKMDVSGPLVAFEIVLDNIPAARKKTTSRPAMNISDLMPVTRDFAFVVDSQTEADRLVRAARGANKKLISDVSVFDVFEGEALGAGKKSIALEVTLQPYDKTLTEADIEAVSSAIIEKVAKATGATLRGQ
ncbi:MAG TPA: phenylalanine--tRNA ligase subunit beta, partial [Rhizobiales bacterium]|nr:phenylalanine--tRNA ligase subunit beta [Hyphomicrobiales bacterium]